MIGPIQPIQPNRPPSTCFAHWTDHVRGVQAPIALRSWLTDTASLTQKLVVHSSHFRVHKLRQERAPCLKDECDAVGLPRSLQVQEREVLLECDGTPVVFAHTIVPLQATAADWPFFGRLGERSLGTTLFGDPRVRRSAMQFARLPARHPLVRRACAALQSVPAAATNAQSAENQTVLFARRCLYRRRRGVLLVTEVFLPSIAALLVPALPELAAPAAPAAAAEAPDASDPLSPMVRSNRPSLYEFPHQ